MRRVGSDVWTAKFIDLRFVAAVAAVVCSVDTLTFSGVDAGTVVCCCMRQSKEARQEDSRPSSLIEGKWYTSMMS